MTPPNTRRWLRHQVKLPVRIITANDISEIAVPGLTTEISRGGMALYGGVPLLPGDLMEVEFQTSNRLRVAASVRDRNGYCFGLEFLGLLPNDSVDTAGPDFAEIPREPYGSAEDEPLVIEAGIQPLATPVRAMEREQEALALFLEKHKAYLHQQESEIKRLRSELQGIRQSRRELDLLIISKVLGRFL